MTTFKEMITLEFEIDEDAIKDEINDFVYNIAYDITTRSLAYDSDLFDPMVERVKDAIIKMLPQILS